MEVLTIIPARGGSKGLPRKNVLDLNGKPLIAHSIEQSLSSRLVTRTIVSTDDNEIADVSKAFGAEVIRRPELISGDTATSESALIHVLDMLGEEGYKPDLIVFLQCTSPIRGLHDIDNAIEILRGDDSDSLLSVSPNHRFLWRSGETGACSVNYDYRNRKRRQDLEPEFVENGSIYVFKPSVLKELHNRLGGKVSLYYMAEESQWEIDSKFDFFIIEKIMKGEHS